MPKMLQGNSFWLGSAALAAPLTSSLYQAGSHEPQPANSEPSPLEGKWQDGGNGQQQQTEEDLQAQEFMESVKRYIRSIDVSNL